MKQDEKDFLIQYYQRNKGLYIEKTSPRDIINEPGFKMHHKRAWYLLEKWAGKNLYEYGVTLDLGWLTEKGVKLAEELIEKMTQI